MRSALLAVSWAADDSLSAIRGVMSSSSAALRERIEPWIRDGKVKILAQIGREKDPDYPDVPLVLDLAANLADRQVMELALAQQAMAWPVVAPPGVPLDRIKALRDAYSTGTSSSFNETSAGSRIPVSQAAASAGASGIL